MSLILCPECKSKISSQAVTCSYCGYIGKNKRLPISKQCTYQTIPIFKYEIQEWDPIQNNNLTIDSINDNKKLVEYFGNWNIIKHNIPSIASVIKEMATKEKILVAKIPDYIKKLIDEGKYYFNYDKNGNLLPTIKDNNNKIIKQFRLEEMTINSPNITNVLNNLSSQMAMNQVLLQLKNVSNNIVAIGVELQNDRLALVDASFQNLKQALLIEDTNIRNQFLLNTITQATQAKCSLIRNYETNYQKLLSENKKGFIANIFNEQDVSNSSLDLLKDLVGITNAVRVECMAYSACGEYQAENECLKEFKTFIDKNKLTLRDTMLLINEALAIPSKNIDLVDQFVEISNKILTCNQNLLLAYY